jgi:hypothetical protein
MSSTTPNLALTLYDSTTDQSVSFATFRAVWGGPSTTSNFYKIDTAYGTLSGQITSLQTTRGAIRVPASYVSANYYEATGISAITAYTTNMSIILSVDTTSSGTVTLNINGLGTKSVMKVNSSGVATNLTGSDLVKGRFYLFNYDGTRWLWVSANSADQISIVGTSGNVVTVGSDNTLLGTTTQAGLVADTTHAATSKGTPVDADELPLSDSAATYALKKVTFANLKTAIGTGLGAVINALTGKSTPVDADMFALADSAASNATKKLTFSDLKTSIGTALGAMINVLTAKTTPVDADMFVISDSAASNASKKLTWANVKSTLKTYLDTLYIINDGWIPSSDTWTYASASTFTVSGDKTAIYKKGTKLKFTQTSVKYAVVVSSSYSAPNTTVTILVNTSYTIANASITSPYYTYVENPQGWPGTFTWSPTWTNLTVGNGTLVATIRIDGTLLKGNINLVWGSTSSIAGAVQFDTPVAASGYGAGAGAYSAIGAVSLIDVGIALYMGEAVLRPTSSKVEIRVINASGTYATWSAISSTVPFTWATTTFPDELDINFSYNI